MGVPVDLTGCASLAGDQGGLGLRVEVGDVKGEDLVGSGGGVVGQAPKGFFAQREVVAPPEGLQLGGGDDPPVGVGPECSALDRRARVRLEGPVTGAESEEGTQGGQVQVPRGWGGVAVVANLLMDLGDRGPSSGS